MKKLIAGLVSLFLFLASPGIFSYQALAGELSELPASDWTPPAPGAALPAPSETGAPLNVLPDSGIKNISDDSGGEIERTLVSEETSVVPNSKGETRTNPGVSRGESPDSKSRNERPAFLAKACRIMFRKGVMIRPAVRVLGKIVSAIKKSKRSPLSLLNFLFDRKKSGSGEPPNHFPGLIAPSRSLTPAQDKPLFPSSGQEISGALDLSNQPPAPTATGPQARKGFQWLARLKELPSSFLWGYVPGWSIAAMGGEMQAVALPVFTAQMFGLPQAIQAAGLNLITRIPGAWLSAFFVGHLSPKTINNIALIVSALSGGLIPLAISLHLPQGVLFSVFLANSALSGLVYGATRGVTENLIPPLLISDRSRREFGLNYAYQWVELSSIAMAMAAVPLLHWLGGSVMLGVSSAFFFIATLFYASLKLNRPALKSESPKTEDHHDGKLSWRSYLPFVFFRFMHFSLYSVFSTVLALGVFHSDRMAGSVIGSYDFGSWLFGLLATLALLPKNGERPWTAVGVGSVLAFLWASFLLPIPMLSMALAGAMGGMIMINSNKWMSLYQQKLPQSKLKNLSKWMMTASILATLPIFAATGLSQLYPSLAAFLSMSHIIFGADILVTILGLATIFSLKIGRKIGGVANLKK